MPEYRRFIAYFYEYIDGKKQKSAGFAKVELRSGMWRILFRLKTDIFPEAPIQVYGFVRKDGYLLGLPMGSMRPGQEMTEEWAYQADAPIGQQYHMEDLAGIWVQSGDDRIFLTVWDDEDVYLDRFVLELPKQTGREMQREEIPGYQAEGTAAGETPDQEGEAQESGDGERAAEAAVNREGEAQESGNGERAAEAAVNWEGEVQESGDREKTAKEAVDREEIDRTAFDNGKPITQGEISGESENGIPESMQIEATELTEERQPEENEEVSAGMGSENLEAAIFPGVHVGSAEAAASDAAIVIETEKQCEKGTEETKSEQKGGMEQSLEQTANAAPEKDIMWEQEWERPDEAGELLRTRPGCQPFSDQEFVNCVMVRPCDINWLQQKGWQVGRSSFLQHGFYQYRHLLLAKTQEGTYVLGVPGIRSPQEKYMAEMFGFPSFKISQPAENNRGFGYWYRPLVRRL